MRLETSSWIEGLVKSLRPRTEGSTLSHDEHLQVCGVSCESYTLYNS